MKPQTTKKRTGTAQTGAMNAADLQQPINPNKTGGAKLQAAGAGGSFGARDLQQTIDPNKTGGPR